MQATIWTPGAVRELLACPAAFRAGSERCDTAPETVRQPAIAAAGNEKYRAAPGSGSRGIEVG